MELFSIPAPRWTSTVHPDPVTSSRKAGGSNDRVASTVTVRKGAIPVGQDGILRGDWQSPRVPVANRHAACQAAPQKNISYRSRHCCNPRAEISLFLSGGLKMRISQVVLALAGTLMCTGCSEMISLHPFVADGEAVQDARLPGVWLDGDNPMYIVRADGNGYTISQSD